MKLGQRLEGRGKSGFSKETVAVNILVGQSRLDNNQHTNIR
jgi:hypothetical protein